MGSREDPGGALRLSSVVGSALSAPLPVHQPIKLSPPPWPMAGRAAGPTPPQSCSGSCSHSQSSDLAPTKGTGRDKCPESFLRSPSLSAAARKRVYKTQMCPGIQSILPDQRVVNIVITHCKCSLPAFPHSVHSVRLGRPTRHASQHPKAKEPEPIHRSTHLPIPGLRKPMQCTRAGGCPATRSSESARPSC